jgi:hypothetical protein
VAVWRGRSLNVATIVRQVGELGPLAFLPSRYLASDWVARKAAAGGEDLIRKAMLALALLAVAAFLPRMIGRFRQGPALSIEQLRERLNRIDELLLLDVYNSDDYARTGTDYGFPQYRPG